jgi:hypothetical protein
MNILGLSFYYHDSAVALVKDGILAAAIAEERISRVKHDSGFPSLAIEWALKEGGITIHDVDYVVFYEKPFVKFERMLMTAMATFPRSAAVFRESMQRWVSDKLWIKSMMSKELGIPGSRFLFCDHHMSHAACSFFTSPFKEAAILTVDGAGEWSTATMGVGRDTKIEIFKEMRFPHSLGLLYSAFTAYCGFEINEGEYKLMGMHPYGKPKYVDKIYEMIEVAADGSLWHNMDFFAYHYSRDTTLRKKFGEHLGRPARDPKLGDKSLDPYYCDMAASIQVVTEQILLKMLTYLKEVTGMKAVVIAGGVALNSVANYKNLRDGPFDDMYIHPAPGDDGGSVGGGVLGLQPPARPAARAGARPRLPRQPLRRRRDRSLPQEERHPLPEDRGQRAILRLRGPVPGGRQGLRLVPRPHGVGPARPGRALDHRGPAQGRDEGAPELEDQVPRALPALRAVRDRGGGQRVLRLPRGRSAPARALHALRGAGAPREAQRPARHHARGRLGPPADGLQGHQPRLPTASSSASAS